MYRVQNKKLQIILIFTVILLIFFAVFYFVIKRHTVKTVYVEGNLHYTQEEMKEYVMSGPFGNNSLFLALKYRLERGESIPFVDAVDVSILAPDTIRISVYEKALAGYIRYMDSYMYFDRDGYAVECSDVKTEGIPQITGLVFDHMILGELLPVEDQSVFQSIMELTKLFEKYGISPDRIFFQSAGDITLYFGEVKVMLGNVPDQLENKIRRLPKLLSMAEGKKGTLHMEKVTEDRPASSFIEEKE